MDELYCGGDLVGYGPHPNEVCALIEERGIPTIYGNYDYAIGRDLEDCGCAYITPHDRELGQRSVEWTLAHTDERSKAFMRDLPFDLRFPMGAQRVRLVHGSPRKVNEYLFEDKPASSTSASPPAEDRGTGLRAHPQAVGARVRRRAVRELRLGRKAQGRRPARPPSRCSSSAGDGIDVTIERVPYDAEAVAREVAAAGLPGEFAEKLVIAA